MTISRSWICGLASISSTITSITLLYSMTDKVVMSEPRMRLLFLLRYAGSPKIDTRTKLSGWILRQQFRVSQGASLASKERAYVVGKLSHQFFKSNSYHYLDNVIKYQRSKSISTLKKRQVYQFGDRTACLHRPVGWWLATAAEVIVHQGSA